jgi:hypothetical protein
LHDRERNQGDHGEHDEEQQEKEGHVASVLEASAWASRQIVGTSP